MYRVGAGRGEVKGREMGWHLDLEFEVGAGHGDKSVLDLRLPLVTRVLGPERGHRVQGTAPVYLFDLGLPHRVSGGGVPLLA